MKEQKPRFCHSARNDENVMLVFLVISLVFPVYTQVPEKLIGSWKYEQTGGVEDTLSSDSAGCIITFVQPDRMIVNLYNHYIWGECLNTDTLSIAFSGDTLRAYGAYFDSALVNPFWKYHVAGSNMLLLSKKTENFGYITEVYFVYSGHIPPPEWPANACSEISHVSPPSNCFPEIDLHLIIRVDLGQSMTCEDAVLLHHSVVSA